MLVVISDLHLADGTSTDNVPARAYALFLEHVVDLAEHAQAREVDLLFLGDVFDLLRTEHWFYPAPGRPLAGAVPPAGGRDEFPGSDRPWGSAGALGDPSALTAGCRVRAREIAERIAVTCSGQLDILSGRDPTLRAVEDELLRARVASKLARATSRPGGAGVQIRRWVLPGNHDRLARVLPDVAKVVCDALGAKLVPDEAGLVRFDEVGLVARHGHELDPLNFEPAEVGTRTPTPQDLLRTPIGDPITTECLARLPYAVRARLLELGVPPETADEVHRHLRGIEEVRPIGAALRWVESAAVHLRERSGADADRVYRAVDAVARSLVPALLRLAYGKAWVRRRLFRPGFSVALAVLGVGLASRLLSLRTIAWLLERPWLVARLARRDQGNAEDALALLDREGGDYAVLGHTHVYRHVPLRVPRGGAEQVYLNSGTWRPRVYEVQERPGFVRAEDLTYLVFYTSRERPVPSSEGARYEAWNGVRGT